MDKAEKTLAKKLLNTYQGLSNSGSFTREEELILERWRVHKIINEDAFVDVTAMSSDHKEYLYGQGYPFTSLGDEEIKKNWYLQFRDSNGVKIIRDIFTVIAFFASLFAVIYSLFDK
jgi:hypothetical protein